MKHIILILIAVALFGCAGSQKPAQCPVNVHAAVEAAIAACNTMASTMPPESLGGLTPSQWCDIAENVSTFVMDTLQCR